MIYFITKHKEAYNTLIDTNLFIDVVILNLEEGMKLYLDKVKKQKTVYLDIEASGLDAYNTEILLVGVKVKSSYFMFDYTADFVTITKTLAKRYVVGHNLKYDIKLLKVSSGILIKKLYDTMIAEQRMFMGADYSFGYADLVERYEKIAVIKATRNEFIGKDPKTFKITYNHLNYLRTDLKHLESIKKKQKVRMHKQNQQFLIYGIECPLVAVIASAELEGFVLNKEKWLDRVKKDVLKKQDILNRLDAIVRNLRDTLPGVDKTLLSGGKWDKERVRNDVVDLISPNGMTEILDLFGNPTASVTLFGKGKRPTKAIPKVAEYPGCIRYTKQEIIHIIGALKQLGITELETFSIPAFHANGKLVEFNKYSVKEAYLERYLVLRPNTPLEGFLKAFGELQKVNKLLSTYGKTFIDKIHTKTGRIHTAFGQCFANTGRMTSGGGDKEPDKINIQNIPRDPEIREAFGVPDGYMVGTDDYSGAELVLMASFAQDFRLLELSKGDMHSHFATAGWREVYKVRAALWKSTGLDGKDMETYLSYVEKSKTFTVTKTEPKGFRTGYKAIAFGVVYGAYPKKVAQVLNISVEEAKGVIKTVKEEIPDTIRMVESKSRFAEQNGYVLHNTRTNSRRWFPALIKQLKGEFNQRDDFMAISEASSAARNSPIQGTQADFIKEASVKLQYYYWKNGYDAVILAWVHDEIVDKLPEEHAEFLSSKKKEILTSTANKYLENVTIDVEQALLPYWTK